MKKKIKCPNCQTDFIPAMDASAGNGTTTNCPNCNEPVTIGLARADVMHASALAALPEIGSDGSLPADIQVFPPGRAVKFTLQDYPGQEFEIDVDATTAAKLDADLQAMLARAASGNGSEPFADKNHEDAEKTFTPLRYFWAGNDKIKGGVRLVPDWVPFGASLVRAKAFKYFSQNFLFSKAKKKVLGLINENVGGLVNRPGFATQAAFAKAQPGPGNAPSTTTKKKHMTTEEKAEFSQIVAEAFKPIGERLTALEAKAKATETAASAGADNKLTEAISTAVTAALKPVQDKIISFETAQKDELKARAKAAVQKHVQRGAIAPQDADAIAFWETSYLLDPAKAETIMGKITPARAGAAARLTSSAGGAAAAAAAATEPEDVFMAKAKAFAKEHDIKNEGDALIAFGRTPEGAELAEQFRGKVHSKAAA
jgi:predicted Zn finger-like uncharacterized protein